MDAINIYYRDYLAKIGGIDTMTYNLARKYSDKKDILFLIGGGDAIQIKRLSEHGRVEIYDKRKAYTCKKLFITYETLTPENIKADKIARVSHGDLFELTANGWKLPIDPKVTEDYGVSTNTCESVEWYTHNPCRLCPNPLIDEDVKPLLKLISPQRMTWEKGKKRIIEMARMLEENDIPYQWLIVCNRKEDVFELNNQNLIWVQSRLDIKPLIKDADYLVLLSDCEGSPMSPQEALMVGTPIIVTDLPCYKDFNIDENYGFFIKKDLSNLDVNEIYKKKDKFKFKWTPPKDIWGEILEDGKVKRKKREILKMIKIKLTTKWKENGGVVCKDLDKIPNGGEIIDVTVERANALISKGYALLIDQPKEPKVEKKVEEKPKKVK